MLVLRPLLGALALVAVAAPAAAEEVPPRNADEWCSAHPGEVLVRDASGVWRRIADNRPREDDEGRLRQAWRGDLDGDGRTDLVLRNTAGCGTRECPIEAFVACSDGTFANVLPPAYGDKVQVVRSRKRGWARIKVRTVGEDKATARRYLWTAYRFGATGYGN